MLLRPDVSNALIGLSAQATIYNTTTSPPCCYGPSVNMATWVCSFGGAHILNPSELPNFITSRGEVDMAASSKIERPPGDCLRPGQAVGLVHLLNPRNPAPEIEYLRKAVPPDTGPRLQRDAQERARLRHLRSEPCGARTRAGHPCRRKGLGRGGRCANHGGMSTGPTTKARRDRIVQAQKRRWAVLKATPVKP
jgi:hypothetical protein